MTFNPEPFQLLEALRSWGAVFGWMSVLLVLVILGASLIAGGTRGLRSIFRALLKGWHQKIAGLVLAVAGAALLAWAGWTYGPRVAEVIVTRLMGLLNRPVQWAPSPGAVQTLRIAGVAVGGALGLLTGLFMGGAIADALHAAPRRVLAIASLTFKEAVRRKALLVFVVFGLLFMFGGWFLSDTNKRADLQVRVYVSFVLTVISWMVVLLMVLLSCWALPEDIRNRSLHTVVTKPVRRNEVLLGRMLGFIGVGTVVLALMGLVGGVWTLRQIPAEGRSQLVCRVPVFGALSWLDRQGNPTSKGVNVGDVWEFRGYIEGQTKSRAIWTFENASPAMLVDVTDSTGTTAPRLMLESRFEAFRTYKGNMNRSVLCQLTLINPDSGLRVPLPSYSVKDFGHNVILVDRKLPFQDQRPGLSAEAQKVRTVDLFDDLVSRGTLTIEAECLDGSQFLGMARPDLFIRTPDRSFLAGYTKALVGIWLMMSLIVVIAVTASTFVKGPVAFILTGTLILIGSTFHEFLQQLVAGQVQGGGVLESTYRIFEHMNQTVDLDKGRGTTVMKAVDKVPEAGLWLVSHIIPNFNRFQMSKYVAYGFDVPFDSAMAPGLGMLAAFLLPCILLGYYSLKLRELESK